MTAYLLRRLGTSIIVLIGISIFVYLLLHAIYPSPARAVLGLKANNAQINAWNQENGFSRPVIEQYLSYMNGNRSLTEVAHVCLSVGSLPVTATISSRLFPRSVNPLHSYSIKLEVST